jgi:signal transduction protein with GAF and PtsI domain
MELSDRKPVDEITFLDEDAQNFIASIGESLTDRDNIDTVLSKVTAFLAAEALSVFLIDESSGDLVLRYATGEVGDEIVGLRLKSGQGVVGWVVKYSEDLIVPYPGMDARFFEGVDESTGFSTRSILCSPIRADERAVGAIEVLNKIEGTFNDDDLILLRAIARLMAEVILTTE